MSYYDKHGNQITASAYHTLYALAIRRDVGRYAARRYAEKRGCAALYRIACQLSVS
jgi:hypothetical protein